jgi:hypothetical protein
MRQFGLLVEDGKPFEHYNLQIQTPWKKKK